MKFTYTNLCMLNIYRNDVTATFLPFFQKWLFYPLAYYISFCYDIRNVNSTVT